MRHPILVLLRWCALILGCVFLAASDVTRTLATAAPRPNILLIISDDQRYDTMDVLPLTRHWIGDQGVTFSNAFVTTPLCCPSRASILTGMQANKHGVTDNVTALTKTTFVQRLHANGYHTALVGRYLNSWDGSARPEFDEWIGAPISNDYSNLHLNVNGTWQYQPGYITIALGNYAQTALTHAMQQSRPFLLVFAPTAPHIPADPAPGDETLYPDLAPYRPPSFNEADVSDKPAWVQAIPPMTATQIQIDDARRKRQLQSLHAVDQANDALLTMLQQAGKLDNTLVMYMSDNGYLWGEHRIDGKLWPYEESPRIPLMLRYPPLVPVARTDPSLVANIDIAPTIYQLAGIPIPADVDGRSLLPLLEHTVTGWRDHLLLEGWWWPTSWQAIRAPNTVYVEPRRDRAELYDLTADPYQLENQADTPAAAPVRDILRQELRQAQAALPPRVTVLGPIEGAISTPITVTADLVPSTIPPPVTYRWTVAGQTLTHTTGLSDTTVFSWRTCGVKQVAVQATAGGRTYADSFPTTLNTAAPAVPGTINGDDTSYNVAFDGWMHVKDRAASGGGYHAASEAGRTMTYRTAGMVTSVGLVTFRGPSQGQAQVVIDGVDRGTLDLYALKAQYRVAQLYDGLTKAKHDIQVRVLGTKNAASTGMQVRVDGFQAGTTIAEDSSPYVAYGSWTARNLAAACGQSYRSTTTAGATVLFSFSGPRFTWLTARGPAMGQVQVAVDRHPVATVDLFAPARDWMRAYVVAGMGPGVHTAQIIALASQNPAAIGTTVVFDAITTP